MKFRCLFRHLGCRQRRTGSVVGSQSSYQLLLCLQAPVDVGNNKSCGKERKGMAFCSFAGPREDNLCGAIE